jgi:hypothetical protein
MIDFKQKPTLRWLGMAVLALLIAVISVWSCRRNENRLDSLEKELEQSGHKMGASAGYVFLGGEQRFQQYTRAREYANDWVAVPANTWTTVYTMPALVPSEVDVYAGLAVISYNNADASVNCDAGACDAVIRRYVPGRYQGGDFCRPDGICASAGAFDVAEDAFVTTTGVMTGALARISWTSPSLVMQVFCPQACTAAASLSGRALKPISDAGIVDSGPADAADAADSSDSGSPPTLSLVTPNIGPTNGGTAVTLTGTNFTGCTGATFAGSPITSFVVASPTSITGVSPSFTTTGLGTGSTVTVNCPQGNVSGSTTPTKFFYSFPTDTAAVVQFNRGDVGATVSQWNDLTANGNNWVQATGGNQPTIQPNFATTALNFYRFNGSTARMNMASFVFGGPNLHASMCIVAREPGGAAAQGYFVVWDPASGLAVRDNGTSNWYATDVGANVVGPVAINTSAHVFCAVATNTGGASTFNVDGTQVTGTLSSNLTSSTATIGALNSSGTSPCAVDIEAIVLWNGTISAGDLTVAIAGLTATSM